MRSWCLAGWNGVLTFNSKEIMVALLEMIDKVFGGPAGYLKNDCGLSDEEIDSLRKALTVPV
jgi:hypothetical protein